MSERQSVTVERSILYAVPGRHFGAGQGRLTAKKWTYETIGPDGRKFTNNSIVELRDVLKRKYGRDLVIVEPWKESKS